MNEVVGSNLGLNLSFDRTVELRKNDFLCLGLHLRLQEKRKHAEVEQAPLITTSLERRMHIGLSSKTERTKQTSGLISSSKTDHSTK